MPDSNSVSQSPSPAPQLIYGFWADRVLAALIDGLIALAALIVMYILLTILLGLLGAGIGGLSRVDQGAANVAAGLGCIGCLLWLMLPPIAYGVVGIYNKVILVSRRGASIGQAWRKLRVVSTDGSKVPTSRLVLRLFVQMGFGLIPLLPLLDLLWPLWDEHRQTLHDKAVGTYVIKATTA